MWSASYVDHTLRCQVYGQLQGCGYGAKRLSKPLLRSASCSCRCAGVTNWSAGMMELSWSMDTTCELTVGLSVEVESKCWKRIEIVPWFNSPVDTQLATPGSVGDTTIVYVPSALVLG